MADDEVKPDEQALLAAWRGGDAAAGQALFRRHYVGLSRFFRSKAGEAAYEL
ncbi:MAG: sigma-70 family RNA polymerase sigma factor, partial [Myxococcales bacterium]|nr:sigma-70 family RNA polymerase sigma factor [Myxococcales bacterium]